MRNIEMINPIDRKEPDFPTIKIDRNLVEVNHDDPDIFRLSAGNDIIREVRIKFADELEQALMRRVQYIGGTAFEEITLDKQKILEALEKCYKPQFVMYRSAESLGELTLRRCKCPRCEHDLTGLIRYPHCPYCGQALDWDWEER